MESDTNEVLDSPGDNTASPRTVRSNWLVFSWNQISQASRILLVLSLSVAVIQIIATITSLCLGKNESCGKPLQSYLIVYVIRVALSFPLLIYQHLFKRRPRGTRTNYSNYNTSTNENNNQSNSVNNDDTNITESGMEIGTTGQDSDTVPTAAATPTTTSPISLTTTSSSSSHSTTSATNVGNGIRWADRIKSLLDLFAILLFIIGNYLAFSSSTCARQAPTLFYTVLAWILLGYMIVLVPVVICASVIFCLPCVLVAIRTFNVNVSTIVVGGSKEEIAKIPVFKYKAAEEQQQQQQQQQEEENNNNDDDTILIFSKNNGNITTSSSSSSSSVASGVSHKQYKVKHKEKSINTTDTNNSNNGPRKPKRLNKILGFFSRQHRKSKDDAEKGKKFKTLTITRQDDAVCSICLCDYENDDLVCKLWCNHHYHKDCVQEWLELNSKCPLCKRDFRGKDHVSNNNDD